ncbi:hypothetical protein HWV07_10195 [Natronomonas salina]|uniref:hypothetical protein n=1 Tax=Natronomonas salina TaxID=1710540 RepID=UPI0015B49603|nr:hypothetical protein [Natronomonas salina]QLD89379.1 hypothetical protein HWV07_10195 [Natronomonas salina]
MVTLPGAVVRRYERFSLYNSPYPAHDRGCAIDLYPGDDEARSPVAGEVLETRTVSCPPKPYAVDEDHLLLVDCGDVVARILHVDPSVTAGESVAVGDRLGTLVRSGFFGRWVDEHLHLGFRKREQNLRRASGSLTLTPDVDVAGVRWDGAGEVVETGPTHVRLDSPGHAGSGFAALASDEGVPLDGGLAHYAGGGVLAPADGEVSLLGTAVGGVDGRDVTWEDVAIRANGRRATGLSLFASRVPFGAKVVFHEGHDLDVGDRVEVTIEPTDDPVRLG